MTVAGSRCPECGAAGGGGSCLAQFHALLALDHQRLQPWGRYHGLNVACFLLQHPSTVTTTVLGEQHLGPEHVTRILAQSRATPAGSACRRCVVG